MSIAGSQTEGLEAEIRPLFRSQEEAWNRGDGAAWGAAFTEDADFVNILGQAFRGREALVEQHRRIFAGPFQGSRATLQITRCTLLAPGIAMIETLHEVTGFKFLPPGIVPTTDRILKTRMKYIALRRGDRWQFVAAQNTAILPMASPQPDPG